MSLYLTSSTSFVMFTGTRAIIVSGMDVSQGSSFGGFTGLEGHGDR